MVVRVEMNYFYMEIICWLNSWRKAFEKCWQWHGSYPLNQCLLWSIYVCFVVYGLFKNTDTIHVWISLCFQSHLTVVFTCLSETFYISNCFVLFIIIDSIGPSFLQKVRKELAAESLTSLGERGTTLGWQSLIQRGTECSKTV